MNGRCACASITFTTPTPHPLTLYHCHCHDCRLQSASAFGTSAIFSFFKIDPSNPHLSHFTRNTDSGRRQKCYFCNKCGSRILHAHVVEGGGDPPVVAVKGGLLEGLDWKAAKHIYTRSAVVKIPEEVEAWEGAPEWGKK